MIDGSFYEKSCESLSVKEILEIIGADFDKNTHLNQAGSILNLAPLDIATQDEVSFLDNAKYQNKVSTSKAKFVIVSESFALQNQDIMEKLIISSDPYLSIAKIAMHLYGSVNHPNLEKLEEKDGYFIHKTAKIGNNVKIGKNVVIGEGVEVGDGSTILHNTVITKGCKIGKNCVVYENCSIRFAKIGDNCIIHSGTRIGQDGFGFAHCKKTKQLFKITHLGLVKLGNNVEIRANVTIDRGSFGGDTELADNVKIDNLTQIGHNVKIGNSTVIAAQAGIAGSTKIGMGCMVGGQVGFSGHLNIGNFVHIAGKSGIFSDIEDGLKLGGSPAIDFMLWKKSTAIVYKAVKTRSKYIKKSRLVKFIRNWLGIE